ncbi:MAG: deoxyribose-phosphate aldolase [Acidimicrobiales bacterium]|nr:deoxyribose-phosphate aldolase [Acidimicrobiales bacterium]
MTTLTPATFAAMVDHTLLAPTATGDDIEALCESAREFGTASVCVNPSWVPLASSSLDDSEVMVCTVAGFPRGADQSEAVAATARIAIAEGADEVDVVIPFGRIIGDDQAFVADYLAQVRDAAAGVTLKVIIESATLSDNQIVTACNLSVEAGADFVKTSTGFHAAGGSSVAAVALMRSTVGPDLGVKASGGIRTLSDVEAMVGAGANRLGMSATAAVLAEIG